MYHFAACRRFSISGELTFPSSVSNSVIQVCKNFWYSRIWSKYSSKKSPVCAVILEQWEMWCVWYWNQHCMANSFTLCVGNLKNCLVQIFDSEWFWTKSPNKFSHFVTECNPKRIILVRDKRENQSLIINNMIPTRAQSGNYFPNWTNYLLINHDFSDSGNNHWQFLLLLLLLN